MPVDEFIDIRLTFSERDLEELDNQIANARERLASSNGDGGGAGASAAAAGGAGTSRRRQAANNLFAFGSNPGGFLQNLVVGAAGAGFILVVTERVLQEISRVDKFFKRFVDLVDTRVDQLTRPEVRASIAAGQTQIIITSAAGTTDPREAYNTFEQFTNNRAQLEADFAIRNTSGFV